MAPPAILKKPPATFSIFAPEASTGEGSTVRGPGALPEMSSQAAVGLIVDGIVKRNFAIAITVDVAETDIFRVDDFDGVRKRLIAADNAIHVQVGDGNVAGIANLEGQREAALAALFFRLQGVDLPVGNVVQHDLVAHVMFAGKFVDAPACRGV